VTLFLQVGHLACLLIASDMQALQKMCPHFVDISSTNGHKQIGQLKVGSFGGRVCTFSLWQKSKTVSIRVSKFINRNMYALHAYAGTSAHAKKKTERPSIIIPILFFYISTVTLKSKQNHNLINYSNIILLYLQCNSKIKTKLQILKGIQGPEYLE
jgi:hypothetical protein